MLRSVIVVVAGLMASLFVLTSSAPAAQETSRVDFLLGSSNTLNLTVEIDAIVDGSDSATTTAGGNILTDLKIDYGIGGVATVSEISLLSRTDAPGGSNVTLTDVSMTPIDILGQVVTINTSSLVGTVDTPAGFEDVVNDEFDMSLHNLTVDSGTVIVDSSGLLIGDTFDQTINLGTAPITEPMLGVGTAVVTLSSQQGDDLTYDAAVTVPIAIEAEAFNDGKGNVATLFVQGTISSTAQFVRTVAKCDFDLDGDCDVADADALTASGDLVAGHPLPPDSRMDLDGSGTIDAVDLTQWLAGAATHNGHASPYLRGDTELDRDIDITDFNTLATNFDPGAVNLNVWSKGDFDGDGDVDITDFNTQASSFAPGGYDGAAATAVADAAPGEVDLVVDLATGEVVLDGNAAAISGLQVFSAGDSLLVSDFTADVLQFVISTNTSTYAEGAFIDTAVNGVVSLGALYDVLVDARDLTFEFTMIGQPTVAGQVIYVPEPTSLALLGIGALLIVRRRRAA